MSWGTVYSRNWPMRMNFSRRRRTSLSGLSRRSSSSCLQQRLLHRRRGRLVVRVAAARRLGNDLVDHAQLEQVGRGDAQRRRGSLAHLRALAVLPEDRRASLDGDHRVDGVLQHVHAVGDAERQRAARAALADDRRDDRHLEPAHLEQVARDRLALPALLGAEPRPRARRVDERDHRDVELLGELHEAQRLSIALRMRHPEVALQVLLRVAAALVADHHHRLAVEARPPADDRGVLAERAVAVQLDEVGEAEPQVVVGERPLVAPRHLHALQRREVAIDRLAQLDELPLERRDLLHHVELPLVGELA